MVRGGGIGVGFMFRRRIEGGNGFRVMVACYNGIYDCIVNRRI